MHFQLKGYKECSSLKLHNCICKWLLYNNITFSSVVQNFKSMTGTFWGSFFLSRHTILIANGGHVFYLHLYCLKQSGNTLEAEVVQPPQKKPNEFYLPFGSVSSLSFSMNFETNPHRAGGSSVGKISFSLESSVCWISRVSHFAKKWSDRREMRICKRYPVACNSESTGRGFFHKDEMFTATGVTSVWTVTNIKHQSTTSYRQPLTITAKVIFCPPDLYFFALNVTSGCCPPPPSENNRLHS